MDLSKITDEQLMWEAKKRFAIPIYYNKQEAEKKIREKDDTFKGMSDDEWDNFKDDFNTGESDQDQLDKIFHDVAYFRFYDGTQVSPSQIAIDAANEHGGDALAYCDICGCDRGHHEVSKRNYLIPCESDGEWSEDEAEQAKRKPKKKKKHKRLVIVDK